MATRALIKVEGLQGVCLYKHFDGYPEATLPWLQDFNESFTKERGDDPEYKFAQLIRSSVLLQEKFNLDPSTTTGWGVFTFKTSDGLPDARQNYTYTLKTDGTVGVE